MEEADPGREEKLCGRARHSAMADLMPQFGTMPLFVRRVLLEGQVLWVSSQCSMLARSYVWPVSTKITGSSLKANKKKALKFGHY